MVVAWLLSLFLGSHKIKFIFRYAISTIKSKLVNAWCHIFRMDNNTPTSTIQDDLSQRNKQLHTIRRSFSKFQMAQQTPTISQLTRH
jgi:hypothetical protein